MSDHRRHPTYDETVRLESRRAPITFLDDLSYESTLQLFGRTLPDLDDADDAEWRAELREATFREGVLFDL